MFSEKELLGNTLPFVFLVVAGVAALLVVINRSSRKLYKDLRKPSAGNLVDHEQQIDRINLLSQNARTTWFALLSYLAFVGVATLGVQDADFFIPARETDLPIVGISIPTARFFAVAPMVGVILHVYLHLHLLKLWDAIAEPPVRIDKQPLSHFISPWLINDLALNRKHPLATQRRPMPILAFGATFLLSFFGAPIVLGYMWIKTWPAHDEALTVLAGGLPLMLSLYAGMKSWVHLCKRTGRPSPHARWKTGHWVALTLAVSLLGWIKTEAGLDHYARLAYAPDPAPEWVLEHPVLSWSQPGWLAAANLNETAFVDLPESWRDLRAWRDAYRIEWCGDYGLSSAACGAVGENANDPASRLFLPRRNWCHATMGPDADCSALNRRAEGTFEAAWREERKSMIAALPKVDLSGRDLRNAELNGAILTGVQMVGTRLQGASLIQAHLQGADLTDAQLQNTRLREARFHEANLQGAMFHGANLRLTKFEGANLSQAQFDADANFNHTVFTGASIWCADISTAPFDQQQLNALFGDGTVKIPDKLDRPPHWPVEKHVPVQFKHHWRDWQQADLNVPPPPDQSIRGVEFQCPLAFEDKLADDPAEAADG